MSALPPKADLGTGRQLRHAGAPIRRASSRVSSYSSSRSNFLCWFTRTGHHRIFILYLFTEPNAWLATDFERHSKHDENDEKASARHRPLSQPDIEFRGYAA